MTIEHLISDDGSMENSSIWNLMLLTEKNNSKDLANKSVNDNIKIFQEKPSIRLNLELNKYIINNEFNFENRKKDIINTIFDDFFHF